MVHRYFYISLPVGTPAEPFGFVARVRFPAPQALPWCPLAVFGWVTYSRPLPFSLVSDYNLIPADEGERMEYLAACQQITWRLDGEDRRPVCVVPAGWDSERGV